MRSTDSRQRPAGQAADQLPRLLPADSGTEPAGLAEHLARYGPLRSAGLSRQRREDLIDEVDRSGLTGRGGAGFPAARKLAAVAAGHAPVVVANGTEGEPGELQGQGPACPVTPAGPGRGGPRGGDSRRQPGGDRRASLGP